MNGILSKIGLFSIALFILYIMKKVNEYFFYKSLGKERYKFDDDDEEDDEY